MNELERILHKYFSDDELEYRYLSGQIDDHAWMEKQGYSDLVKSGLGMSRELTPKGKKFVTEAENRISTLISALTNNRATSTEVESAQREIKSYLYSHPDIVIEDELPDNMYYAYLSLSPDY